MNRVGFNAAALNGSVRAVAGARATLSGVATITAGLTQTQQARATFSGTAHCAAPAVNTLYSAGEFVAYGLVDASAHLDALASALLAGTSALETSTYLAAYAAATFECEAQISARGVNSSLAGEALCEATLSATATVTRVVPQRSVPAQGTALLTATPSMNRSGGAHIALGAVASLRLSPSYKASGETHWQEDAHARPMGVASMTMSAVMSPRVAPFTGHAVLSATTVHHQFVQRGEVGVSVCTGTLVAAPVRVTFAQAEMAGTSATSSVLGDVWQWGRATFRGAAACSGRMVSALFPRAQMVGQSALESRDHSDKRGAAKFIAWSAFANPVGAVRVVQARAQFSCTSGVSAPSGLLQQAQATLPTGAGELVGAAVRVVEPEAAFSGLGLAAVTDEPVVYKLPSAQMLTASSLTVAADNLVMAHATATARVTLRAEPQLMQHLAVATTAVATLTTAPTQIHFAQIGGTEILGVVQARAMRVVSTALLISAQGLFAPSGTRLTYSQAHLPGLSALVPEPWILSRSLDPPWRTFTRPAAQLEFTRPAVATEFRRGTDWSPQRVAA